MNGPNLQNGDEPRETSPADPQGPSAQDALVGELKQLRDFAEIKVRHIHQDRAPEVGAKVIKHNGVQFQTLEAYSFDRLDAHTALEVGDILVSSLGEEGLPLDVLEVHKEDLPAFADKSVITVRPKPDLPFFQWYFIKKHLSTSHAAERLPTRPSAKGWMRHDAEDLGELEIPFFDEEFGAVIEATEDALLKLERWYDEGEGLLRSLYSSGAPHQARGEMIRKSVLLRQRVATAALLDDFDWQVSTRFPLPVAYKWRRAIAARDTPEEKEQILQTFETLLAFLAIMAVTGAKSASIDLGKFAEMQKTMVQRSTGPTLGNWYSILDQTKEMRALKQLPGGQPFAEAFAFLRDPEVEEHVDFLKAIRNGSAHGREAGPAEKAQQKQMMRDALYRIGKAAEFCTDYPLILIEDTRWNAARSRNKLLVRPLRGDNPVVPRRDWDSNESTIEKGSLYLSDRSENLYLLRPLMIGRECPECGYWSTFHPDRIMKRTGEVEFKSFEHGHPMLIESDEAQLEDFGWPTA